MTLAALKVIMDTDSTNLPSLAIS